MTRFLLIFGAIFIAAPAFAQHAVFDDIPRNMSDIGDADSTGQQAAAHWFYDAASPIQGQDTRPEAVYPQLACVPSYSPFAFSGAGLGITLALQNSALPISDQCWTTGELVTDTAGGAFNQNWQYGSFFAKIKMAGGLGSTTGFHLQSLTSGGQNFSFQVDYFGGFGNQLTFGVFDKLNNFGYTCNVALPFDPTASANLYGIQWLAPTSTQKQVVLLTVNHKDAGCRIPVNDADVSSPVYLEIFQNVTNQVGDPANFSADTAQFTGVAVEQ